MNKKLKSSLIFGVSVAVFSQLFVYFFNGAFSLFFLAISMAFCFILTSGICYAFLSYKEKRRKERE